MRHALFRNVRASDPVLLPASGKADTLAGRRTGSGATAPDGASRRRQTTSGDGFVSQRWLGCTYRSRRPLDVANVGRRAVRRMDAAPGGPMDGFTASRRSDFGTAGEMPQAPRDSGFERYHRTLTQPSSDLPRTYGRGKERQRPSTSAIEYRPGGRPTTHRAATKAPRAKPDRSWAWCTSSTVSPGPAKISR